MIFRFLFFNFLFIVPLYAQTPLRWQQTNGPYIGYIYPLIIASDGSLYAGTSLVKGTIYRSTNDGAEWERIRDGIAFGDIAALAVSRDLNSIFAGTRDGLLRSTDKGGSWAPCTTGFGERKSIYSLAIDAEENVFAGTDMGIFRSQPAGNSWEQVGKGIVTPGVRTIIFGSQNEVYVGADPANLFHSSDAGVTWTNVSHGITSWSLSSLTRDSSGSLYVGTSNGVFVSTDYGANWVERSNGLPMFSGSLEKSISSLFCGPDQSIYAGPLGGGLFKSIDQGLTWSKQYNDGLPDMADIEAGITNNQGHIFISAFQDGIYKSTDNGERWEPVNQGILSSMVASLFFKQGSGFLYAIAHGHLFRTQDHGEEWEEVVIPESLRVSCVTQGLNGELYVGGGSLYRSTNEGQAWEKLPTGASSLGVHPQTGHLFVAIGEGISRSTDNGHSWNTIFRDDWAHSFFLVTITSSGYMFIRFIQYNRIHCIFTPDEGEHWYNTGLGDVTSIIELPSGELFASTSQWGVYGSMSNGYQWQWASEGLPLDLIHGDAVFALTSDRQGILYAGTNRGIYLSTDKGSHWQQQNDGLSTPYIFSLATDNDGYLYAGTDESGVFSTTSSVTGAATENQSYPHNTALLQNYPNPFNPKTHLRFTIAPPSRSGEFDPSGLSDAGFVSLKIYNVLGSEVAVLVHETKPPGSYEVEWDASALPSGIYLANLTVTKNTGNEVFNDVKKLLLVR